MELISYLHYCLKRGRLIRWPDNCMPLKVFIGPFKWYKAVHEAYQYQQMVLDAFNLWQKVSDGRVSFEFVTNINNSQINLSWKRVDRESLGKCYYNYDEYGRLYSAEVVIGLSDGLIHAKYEDKNEVYHTILHEVGHALGLDHSPYRMDIMYVPHQYGTISLTSRDIMTFNCLYNLPHGASDKEILSLYNMPSAQNLDELVYRLQNEPKSETAQDIEEFKLPDETSQENLDKEQETLAELGKYHISIQNIGLSKNFQSYFKNLQSKK
jgi:hypothetical protein